MEIPSSAKGRLKTLAAIQEQRPALIRRFAHTRARQRASSVNQSAKNAVSRKARGDNWDGKRAVSLDGEARRMIIASIIALVILSYTSYTFAWKHIREQLRHFYPFLSLRESTVR
jgi:hypothetical protein